MAPIDAPPEKKPTRTANWLWLVIVGVSVVAAFGFLQRLGYLDRIGSHSREYLITQVLWLRSLQEQHPQAVYAIGFAIYVVLAGLSLPGAALMTLAYGWMFGFWGALILVSFGSTTGASVAFLLSRYLLRHRIQGLFRDRLRHVNDALEREGAYYLFTLRLIPAVPFFIINLLMGLTFLRFRTFWWVSQLGMLPGTAVYVYAGTTLPDIEALSNPTFSKIITPQLLLAFVLLGIFPLLVRKVISKGK